MISFSLSEEEEAAYKKWWAIHKLACPHMDKTNGPTISWIFIPLGFGTVVKIKCSCGTTIDVTDSENW
jgi:hypothetical protein